jgi:hypothetical protein
MLYLTVLTFTRDFLATGAATKSLVLKAFHLKRLSSEL